MQSQPFQESPLYVRTSLAAAITLGFQRGLFYRNATLYCVNLLLTYQSGCVAKCAYCGLASQREGRFNDKSFIRVAWPTFSLDEIIAAVHGKRDSVKRICVSQVTQGSAARDTETICCRLRGKLALPLSVLVAPTVTTREDLRAYKAAGADKIGIAMDLATPDLFDQYRGHGVGGPHRWDIYVERLEQAIEIFGVRNAGAHLMCGMGETEREMVDAIQTIQDMGGWTHLFSFFPESESPLKDRPAPPMDQYRRIQLARFLIDGKLSNGARLAYDDRCRIVDYGVSGDLLDDVIGSGEPFRTSGCPGNDGEVACNRPYGNSRPGPDIRNYPFPPQGEDIARIREQMAYMPERDLRNG